MSSGTSRKRTPPSTLKGKARQRDSEDSEESEDSEDSEESDESDDSGSEVEELVSQQGSL